MDTKDKRIISSVLAGGKPYRSYIKTILGKVYVSVWNTFEQQPEGVILHGDPRTEEETAIIDLFSEEEDFYFRQKNKKHLQTGDVIQYNRKEEERVRTPEEFSDDELKEILAKPFFSTQKLLNETESVALLFRIKNLAHDMDKSDKVMRAIEARISEVQANEFKPLPDKIETEL